FRFAGLMKIWPLVILPLAIVKRRLTVLVGAFIVLGAGGVAWLLWGGLNAPGQVATFRGATGWEAESPIGTVVWIITGGPIYFEQGAPRVGAIEPWARAAMAMALTSSLVLVWWRARRWPG